MNEQKEIALIKSIKSETVKSIVKWMVFFVFGCVVALVVFYFETTPVLAQTVKDTTENTVAIKEVEESVKEVEKSVNELKVIPKLNAQKIENIEGDVSELKEGQKEIMRLLIQIKQKQD